MVRVGKSAASLFPFPFSLLDAVLKDTPSDIAHGGNHASSFNGGNLRNGLASQDRGRGANPLGLHRFSQTQLVSFVVSEFTFI